MRKNKKHFRWVAAVIIALSILASGTGAAAAAPGTAGSSLGGYEDTGSAKNPLFFTAAPSPSVRDCPLVIDVSEFQSVIDWDTAAKYIDYAIIRCGYGSDRPIQDDYLFKRNADACTRLGIPFGVYLYSYAESDTQALSEAQHALRMIEGYDLSLPVYLDLEDIATVGRQSDSDILRHAQIFCDTIERAGYEAGIYSFYYWWIDRLAAAEYSSWSRWMAAWGEFDISYMDYDGWQFSREGRIEGISCDVDLNYWFADVPCIGDSGSAVSKYTDCPPKGNWAYDGIEYCVQKGYMKGISSHEFGTSQNVTRAQIVTIIYRMAGEPRIAYSGVFKDVPKGKWYTNAIEWAAAKGIVNGISDHCFAPDDPLTRQQLCCVFARCYQMLGNGNRRIDPSLTLSFPDAGAVSGYAVTAVRWAVESALINGITDSSGKVMLCPNGNTTRAQIAAIIMRFERIT